MKPRILVIRGGAIGDFILTLPAIKLLRDHFPAAQIEIPGYKHILVLVRVGMIEPLALCNCSRDRVGEHPTILWNTRLK